MKNDNGISSLAVCGVKNNLSSLAVCGASPRQGISTFGKAASISDIALRKGQIAGRSDAQRTSSDDNIGFKSQRTSSDDNIGFKSQFTSSDDNIGFAAANDNATITTIAA